MQALQYPALQHRWQVRDADSGDSCLVYYGLRNPPNHTRNIIELPTGFDDFLKKLDGSRQASDLPAGFSGHGFYRNLVDEGVIVEANQVRTPATRGHFRECSRCITNDYLLPGLEFDGNGMCAFCQCYEQAEKTGISAGPREHATDDELLEIAARNTDSRFDAMVLCTGGKDSTFLLWYLAEKLKLRVLAASWNMPYTNETCRNNMRRALKVLPDVEFVERTLPWNMVRSAMQSQFKGVGLPCLCPMVAHALFYPLAVQEKIPLIMQGVEEVQLAVMSYVMSELKSGGLKEQGPPDYRRNTLNFLHMIDSTAKPRQPFALNADMLNYTASIKKNLASVYSGLEQILDQAEKNPDMPIPVLRRLQTNTSYGSWADVVDLIKKEMEWQMPPGQKGLLHTSCRIEKVKDYCQLNRFQAMRSTSFPQSVVELGAGVYFGLISRQNAAEELEELGYYDRPQGLDPLLEDLGIRPDHSGNPGEAAWSLGFCKD